MPLRLICFGELALQDAGSGRKLAVPRKGLAVLAVLAASGPKTVSRERLTALLWPESGESARQSLKQTIYELRQAVGDHAIISGSAELSLDPAVSSDIAGFQAALQISDDERVVEFYRGPFLDGFHLRDSVEFDHWADGRRADYESAFRTALERLACRQAEAGDLRKAVELWRRLATVDPLGARATVGLIEALAATGDAVGGLMHFQSYERALRDELGLQPDPTVIAAVSRIRSSAGQRDIGIPVSSAHTAELVRSQRGQRPIKISLALIASVLVLGLIMVAVAARTGNARVLASISLPQRAYRVAVDPHIGKVYVDGGAGFDASLSVVEENARSPRTIPHGAGTAVDPITHWYWSGDYGGRFVVVRNGRTDAEIARVPVPGCPHAFAVAGEHVWVAQQCDDHISVIDSRQRRVVRHIPISTLSREEVGGAKGMGEIFVNRNTNVAYFSKDGIPHRVDTARWELRETHGFDGPVIAINEPTNRLYVQVEHGLRIIDGSTEKMIGQVLLPSTPTRAAVGFGGQRVYVTTNAGLVALDGETQRILYVLPLGDGFIADAVAIDVARNRAYVAGNESSGARSLKIVALDS